MVPSQTQKVMHVHWTVRVRETAAGILKNEQGNEKMQRIGAYLSNDMDSSTTAAIKDAKTVGPDGTIMA